MPESGETAKLPGALPIAADFGFPFNNFGKFTLDGAINAAVETFTVLEVVPVDTPQIGWVTIDSEVIKHVSWAGKVFTCTGGRGADGTTAATHANAAVVGRYIHERTLNQIMAELLQVARFVFRSAREDVTGATTVDLGDATKPYNRFHRLTGNVNYTITNMPTRGPFSIETEQDATGGRTFTFTTVVKWKGGAQPAPSTTAGKKALWVFEYDGTDILGDCVFDF